MNNTQTASLNYEAIAWGALFIWWGITELVPFLPNGTGALGVGLILLGLNAVRYMNRVPISKFSTSLGILALVWGSLELAGTVLRLPFDLPIFAILLITLGGLVLGGEIFQNQKDAD